jgi:hypothetical protein
MVPDLSSSERNADARARADRSTSLCERPYVGARGREWQLLLVVTFDAGGGRILNAQIERVAQDERGGDIHLSRRTRQMTAGDSGAEQTYGP